MLEDTEKGISSARLLLTAATKTQRALAKRKTNPSDDPEQFHLWHTLKKPGFERYMHPNVDALGLHSQDM